MFLHRLIYFAVLSWHVTGGISSLECKSFERLISMEVNDKGISVFLVVLSVVT